MRQTRRRAPRSLCGLFDCATCDVAASEACSTCIAGNRALARHDKPVCDVYLCVKERGVSSCRECAVRDCPILRRRRLNPCALRGRGTVAAQRRTFADALSLWRARPSTEGLAGSTAARRIGQYLWVLDGLAQAGVEAVTSAEFARKAGVRAALVRKDLARLGSLGTRSAGYEVTRLLESLREAIGLAEPRRVAWLGADALRRETRAAELLSRHNCRIVAVFDDDPDHLHGEIAELQVQPLSRLPEAARSEGITLGIIALHDERAQTGAELLVRSGVRDLLNLTETPLAVPADVTVEDLGLSARLASLLARSATAAPPSARRGRRG
jgi:redox-sensing transcriptional repressor